MVIVSCAYTERSYPAIAIEVQHELGITGTGFDMLVACSAATFALQRACDAIAAGSARAVLVINPELTSPQVNYRDRDSHFIFGDVSTAMVLEAAETCTAPHAYDVLGSRSQTVFSNNIRSNFGYVAYAQDVDPYCEENLFHQNGRSVFKEVCPMAAEHLTDQIERGHLGALVTRLDLGRRGGRVDRCVAAPRPLQQAALAAGDAANRDDHAVRPAPVPRPRVQAPARHPKRGDGLRRR